MKKIFVFAAVFLCSLFPAAHAGELLWSSTIEEDVEWSMVTSAGTLLINTGTQVIHLDSETGEILWNKSTEKKLAPFNFHDLEGSGYMLIAEQYANIPPKTRLTMFDLLSGEMIWQSEELFASNLAVIPDLERGQVLHIGGFPGSPADPTSGNILRAYDVVTGEIRFQTELSKVNKMPMHQTDTAGFFTAAFDLSGHSAPVMEGNVLYLPYLGVMAVNLDSGALLWSQEFEPSVADVKQAFSPIVIEGDTIYKSGRGTVVAIDKLSGQLRWQSKVKKSYTTPELLVLGDQVVVRVGGMFSNGKGMVPKKPFGVLSLDKATGAEKWNWTKAKDGITNVAVLEELKQLVVADSKNLYRLGLDSSGKATVLEKRDLEFKRKFGAADTAVAGGKVVSGLLSGGILGGLQGGLSAAGSDDRSDPPTTIARVDDNLVVSGNYHVLSYNAATDSDNWSIAFEPPGVNPMLMALSGATMALTAMGNAGMHSSMSVRNSKLDSALGSADRMGSIMTKRYSASQQAGHLAFYLTKSDADDAATKLELVGVDLGSGEPVGEVPIEEKEPVFAVDQLGRRVYYFYKGNEVRAFGF